MDITSDLLLPSDPPIGRSAAVASSPKALDDAAARRALFETALDRARESLPGRQGLTTEAGIAADGFHAASAAADAAPTDPSATAQATRLLLWSDPLAVAAGPDGQSIPPAVASPADVHAGPASSDHDAVRRPQSMRATAPVTEQAATGRVVVESVSDSSAAGSEPWVEVLPVSPHSPASIPTSIPAAVTAAASTAQAPAATASGASAPPAGGPFSTAFPPSREAMISSAGSKEWSEAPSRTAPPNGPADAVPAVPRSEVSPLDRPTIRFDGIGDPRFASGAAYPSAVEARGPRPGESGGGRHAPTPPGQTGARPQVIESPVRGPEGAPWAAQPRSLFQPELETMPQPAHTPIAEASEALVETELRGGFRVLLPPTPGPDPASLLRFARQAGMDEAGLVRLFGTPLVAANPPTGDAVFVGSLSTRFLPAAGDATGRRGAAALPHAPTGAPAERPLQLAASGLAMTALRPEPLLRLPAPAASASADRGPAASPAAAPQIIPLPVAELTGPGGEAEVQALMRDPDGESFRALASRLADAIGERIASQARQGQWQLHLVLTPRSLGRIEIDLRVNGVELEASITTPPGAVRELVVDGLPRLRETLQQLGMEVASLDAGSGQGSRSGGNPTPRESTFDRPTAGERADPGGSREGAAGIANRSPGGDDTRVDLWA